MFLFESDNGLNSVHRWHGVGTWLTESHSAPAFAHSFPLVHLVCVLRGTPYPSNFIMSCT